MRALLDALIFLCSDMIMLNSLYRLYGIYFDRSVVNRRKEYLAYGAYWLIHFLNYDLVGLSLFTPWEPGYHCWPWPSFIREGFPECWCGFLA